MKKILILIILLTCSTTAFSAELYCKSKAGLQTKLPDPKIMSGEEYRSFTKYLADHYNIMWITPCLVEQSPEIYKLYKEIIANQYGTQKSDFDKSPYALKFIETQKTKFDLNWGMFNNPFEMMSFPAWITRSRPSALSAGKISGEPLNVLVNEYKEVIRKKQDLLMAEAADREAKLAEEKRIAAQKLADEIEFDNSMLEWYEGYKYDMVQYTYQTAIVEKGENILKEADSFIKRKLAENKTDFYQRVYFAATNMELGENLMKIFGGQLKGTGFRIYDNLSLPGIYIAQNRMNDLRAFFKANPTFKITENEFARSAHLFDSKIYNYLKYERKFAIVTPRPTELDYSVLQADLNVNPVGELFNNALTLNSSGIGTRVDKHYSTYFFSRYPKMSSKHMIGYGIFEVNFEPDVINVLKKKNIALPETSFREYAYTQPSWESKKIPLRLANEKIAPGFIRESMFNSKEGLEFFETSGNWMAFMNGKEKYWIHRSQVKEIKFSDRVIQRWALIKNGDAVYAEPGAAKPLNLSDTENHALVIARRWINNELWLNVNLMKAPCSKDKRKEVYDVWIKAFNAESKGNIVFPTSC